MGKETIRTILSRDLLPYNTTGLPNAGGPSPTLFLAGDVRVNEQTSLIAMHTLFVREHNYWSKKYKELNPNASGEETYQFARMIVGAEMQSISNLFATAAYRFEYNLLSPTLRRIDAKGNAISVGHLSGRRFSDPPTLKKNASILFFAD